LAMAEDDIKDDDIKGAEGEDGEEGGKKKRSGKKIVIIAVAVLLLIGIGATAAYMTGLLDGVLGHGEEVAEGEHDPDLEAELAHQDDGTGVYIEIENFVVTLNSANVRDPDKL